MFTADPNDYIIITTTDSGSVVVAIVASVVALVLAIGVSIITVVLICCLCHHSKSIHIYSKYLYMLHIIDCCGGHCTLQKFQRLVELILMSKKYDYCVSFQRSRVNRGQRVEINVS